MAAPELWDDQARAADILRERASLIQATEEYEARRQRLEDLELMLDMALEEEDQQTMKEVVRDLAAMEREFSDWELKLLLGAEDDDKNAIVTIHAGAGGTEAQDWAEILLRMYLRYAERKGFKTETIDLLPGDEAGVKSVTFTVEGDYAYGYLKHEAGTHRLVRQSPFNADKLRQTSFALVEVMPELEDVDLKDVEIKDEDLDWQFIHAGGHGGQNVNKVATAVRLTHIPSGIVITASTERFQEQNRKIALELLRGKLWLRQQEIAKGLKKELKGDYRPASWGTQIRSYVLHPYKMVKDLRTDVETGNTERVLDGEIDEFIDAELKIH